MATKENEKKSTIKLKSNEDLKARMLKRLSSESANKNLITRIGANEEPAEKEAFNLSYHEKKRRIEALEIAEKENAFKPEKKAKISTPSIEETISMEEIKPEDIEVQKIEPAAKILDADLLNQKIEIETKSEKKDSKKVKKQEVEAPVISFKQGETVQTIEDLVKTETEVKIDRRDKSLIEKMMKHYKYLEFDDDKEIEDLQKGLELRNAIEERRKGTASNNYEEDISIQSSNEAEEEVIKIRREAYFSRHDRKSPRRVQQTNAFVPKEINIYDKNIVIDVARTLAIKVEDLIKKLRHIGVHVKENDYIDGDTAELAIEEMGHIVKRTKLKTAEDKLTKKINSENLQSVVPVVTIMGHVDHGKTTLLDALRGEDVAGGEAGGITQHIGAYQTTLKNGKKITFIDTPGHEAFTSIRARGASVTHVIVLVIAGDDGVMPQTVEAINHAKAAGVPIVVAVNKMDKPGSDLQKVKNELLIHELVSEDLGGDIIFVPVSAKTGQNLEKLCEAILLQAEVLDMKAEYNISASGIVLEGKIEKQKGVVATLLVQNGTLKTGDIIVIESNYGKIRTMNDYKGIEIKKAEPSTPVQVYGLPEVPMPGTQFNVVESEKLAKEITAHRKQKKQEQAQKGLVNPFGNFLKPKEEKKALNLIIRADVQSTIEAIKYSLNGIELPSEVEIKIIQASVGSVSEADITFAKTYNAVIFAFAVKIGSKEEELAKKSGIVLKQYNIIYHIVDDVKEMLSAKLSPIIKDEIIGEAEVRAIFDVSKSGQIAGCMIKKGIAKRNSIVKVYRNEKEVAEGKLKTLKHFKEDVKELATGNECGIQVEGFEGFEQGDIIQIIERTEQKRTI